ncbi:MAG: c-type cytochrome [Saprospiraceae bacterium]|nr:c-type cytochrome [Saprospiraceae bacterium]
MIFINNQIFLAVADSTDTLKNALTWSLNNVFAILALLISFLAMWAIWKVVNVLSNSQKEFLYTKHGIPLETIKKDTPSLFNFKGINDALWKLVPLEKEADIDLGHEYDGIRELDNRLPPWWLYIFYGTILFAAVYLYLYLFTDKGVRQEQEYEYAMEKGEEMKLAYLATQANAVDENSVVALTGAELAEGQSIFKASCAACHGQEGQGGVGPNLTDQYWIHGGGINNVFKTIKYGVPDKGMISWQSQLSPSAMQKVASYILTLEGTNPPGQKEKQGEIWTPESGAKL